MNQPSSEALFEAKSVVIFGGPGGVGKTTMAAAAAVKAAVDHPRRVLVLTIDPARRLADALGLREISNEIREVDLEGLLPRSTDPKGELHASMLDTKASWDQLVLRHSPDEKTARKILANPLYQNISAKFVQSHEYIAMERLYELYSTAQYDLIVIDTPPSRNALDFFDAPARMEDFFSSRLLRWLIAPYRSSVFNLASRPFYQLADRILGSQFLSDISDFFLLFRSMYDGFTSRAKSIERLLRSDSTSLVVVTSLEYVAAREARAFITEAAKRSMEVSGVLINKVLPPAFSDKEIVACAEAALKRSHELDLETSRLITGVARIVIDYHKLALHHRQSLALFKDMPAWKSPYLPREPVDLLSLLELGRATFK